MIRKEKYGMSRINCSRCVRLTLEYTTLVFNHPTPRPKMAPMLQLQWHDQKGKRGSWGPGYSNLASRISCVNSSNIKFVVHGILTEIPVLLFGSSSANHTPGGLKKPKQQQERSTAWLTAQWIGGHYKWTSNLCQARPRLSAGAWDILPSYLIKKLGEPEVFNCLKTIVFPTEEMIILRFEEKCYHWRSSPRELQNKWDTLEDNHSQFPLYFNIYCISCIGLKVFQIWWSDWMFADNYRTSLSSLTLDGMVRVLIDDFNSVVYRLRTWMRPVKCDFIVLSWDSSLGFADHCCTSFFLLLPLYSLYHNLRPTG